MKVSVWMSAYNHEKYLSQCLDSVLMQKTDFDFEIILGEDCSTDKTREIAIEYQKKYPEKLKLFLPENNIGMMEIDVATHRLCKGKYLALLNGDDYWTDKSKLQRQADLLDSDSGISMCYHRTYVIDEINGNTWETEFTGEKNNLPIEKLFKGFNPIMTSSVMCRNFKSLPEWYTEMPFGDMPLYLMLYETGKISYIERTMGVYRIHNSGNWQGDSLIKNLNKDILYYKLVDEKFKFKYSLHIKKILAKRFFDLIILSLRDNNKEIAKMYYYKLQEVGFEYLNYNKNEIPMLYEIIFNNSDNLNYPELFDREIEWKLS